MADKFPPRNGENSLWKLLRLWPIILAFTAVVGSLYVTANDVGRVKVSDKIQWEKIGGNTSSIAVLTGRTDVIDARMENFKEAQTEMKADIKEILKAVKP